MCLNMISLDLITLLLFVVVALLAYIAWQVTPKGGRK